MSLALHFFVSLFSIVNPFAAIPTFVGLTAGMTPTERSRTITVSSSAVLVILLVSYAVGQSLLAFFGVSVAALRVAGGMLIFSMAWSMLQAKMSSAKQTPEEAAEPRDHSSIAIVPFAIPMLAGPGAISLMILEAEGTSGLEQHLEVVGAVVALVICLWVTLQAAEPIATRLGQTGLNVATRLMGLILAAIAVGFITGGLATIFPGWTATG